jgi:succinate dehydrogenase/fumarate reductase cytochrome b subunit
MKQYKIRILHPNAITRLRLQPVMHGLAGILFLMNAIGIYNSPAPNWGMAIFFILLGFACLTFPFIMKRFRNIQAANSLARMVEAFVSLTGCLFFLSHMQPLISGLLFLTGIASAYIGWAEYKIFQPCFVKVDMMGVTLPGTFSERLIGWNQLNNVVLRNDLLTIDFRNNKVLQLEVLDEADTATADEMNAFFSSRR